MFIDIVINLRLYLLTGLVCLLTLAIAIFAWKRRKAPGALFLSLISFLSALWGILFLLEISFEPVEMKLIFRQLTYIPMCFIPALFICLTADADALKISKKFRWLFFIEPALANAVVWTNPFTGWFRRGFSILTVDAGRTIIASQYSWGFWVHMLYVEVAILVCLVAWVSLYYRSPRWYRGLAGTVFFATLIPWVTTLLTVPKWLQGSTDLLFLFSMIVSIILLAIGILQRRVLEFLPIAQDTLLAQMSDAVIVIDNKGKIASYNQAAKKLPGLKDIDLTGVPLSKLGDGWPMVAAASTPPASAQKIITLGDPEHPSIFDLRITDLSDSIHPPIGALIILREITQEINAARQRMEVEERYRTIFENASDAILLEDENESIIEVNQKTCTLTGYTSEELRTMRTSDLQPEEHRNNPRLEEYEQKSAGPAHPVEIELLHKDGSRIPVELTLAPINTGEHPLFLSILRDIRERKQAEELARAALNTTQARVSELGLLRQLAESFNQAADMPSALKAAFDAVHQVTNSNQIWVFLEEPESEECHSMIYETAENGGAVLKTCTASEIHGECLSLLNQNALTEPRMITGCGCSQEFTAEGFPVNEHFVMPLGLGKSITGVLNLVPGRDTDFSQEKIHLVQTICDSLSITLERILYYEREREQRERAETLQSIGAALTASLNIDDVLDLLLAQLSRLIPYDAGNIMIIEGSKARILRHRGYEKFDPAAAEKLSTMQFDIHLTDNLRLIRERREPVIIGDVNAFPGWVHNDLTQYFGSWLGGPVLIQEKVAFIFSLDKIKPNSFTPEDAERLSAFTARAALSIQNAKLYEAEKKRSRELQELQATLRDISSELDLTQLLKKIVDRAIALTGASIGELALFDKNSNDLEVVVSTNLDKDYTGNRIKIGEGVLGRVAKYREPFMVANYNKWEKRLPEYEDLAPQAALAVPMLAGDDLIGVVGVGDYNVERKFNEDDIRLLNLFAKQATVAIRNARLYKIAKRQAEEAETLRQAGSVIVSTLHQEESLERILEQLATVVPYDSASVALLRDNELEIVGGHGFKDPKQIIGMRFPLTRDHPGAVVFLDQKPLILKDAPLEFNEFNKIPVSIHSWLGVPLTYKDKTIGILSLDASAVNQFTEEHAHLVQAFADQVSISLENARLYDQAVKSASRQEIIYRLTQEINANLREDQVCTAIHRATSSLMPTECFVISMLDERAHEIADIYLVDRGAPQPLNRRPASQGLFAKVIADGRSRKYDTFDQQLIVQTGAILLGPEIDDSITQSILCVPLKLGNKVKGVLSAQSYQPNQYSNEDLETLELLAANGMIALENSRLFGEVQQLAITDPLTQIFNRRRFFELTELEFERSHRYNRPLSVIMLDIDHFKKVNDRFGHLVGDQVLQRLAEICSENLRQIDILARYGGEEFVILLPETNAAAAYASAERLRHEVAKEPFSTMRGLISITISLGVVEMDSTCKNTEELLDRSDQALYHSKGTGRNRTTIWTTDLKPSASGGSIPPSAMIK